MDENSPFAKERFNLPWEGRAIEQIYALARIFFYIYLPINTKNECKVVILLS